MDRMEPKSINRTKESNNYPYVPTELAKNVGLNTSYGIIENGPRLKRKYSLLRFLLHMKSRDPLALQHLEQRIFWHINLNYLNVLNKRTNSS